MYFELFKESMVIAAGVLFFIVAWTMYKRNRITGRPPVISYAVPWVGSALDLGRCPDAFFKRAMYVEYLLAHSEADDEPSAFQRKIRGHFLSHRPGTDYHLCYFATGESGWKHPTMERFG